MDYQNDSLELPVYTPSSPSPSYTCDLAYGESRLEHTPRTRPAPTSLFIKKAGKTTIVLNEQEDGAMTPTYGRGATISGNLFLEHSEDILEVTLKVKGKLDATTSEVGAQSIKTVDSSCTLWSSSTSRPQRSSCPGQLAFSVSLPTTFTHSSQSYSLPPTYHAEFFSVTSLFVRSVYTLHFVITRVRHKTLDLWTKTKQILIPFKYVPRTRPNRPILPSPCFFSSVKTSPEEWYQAVTPLKTRTESASDPIYCHLFVPASRIFGLSDTIPFHVQLSGNTCTLRDLFSDIPLDRITSTDSYNTVASKKPPAQKPLIHASILRQVTVTVRGAKSFKNSIIAEGTIWPIPPDLSTCCSSTSECKEGHVDWEGELRCQSDISVGGFEAANVHVKDFITLTLTPPNPQTSPLLQLQITVPIRLVTESWGDFAGFDLGSV
ncbi:hypothetical protein D9613_005967 [Agrocybe pediades]|uniref:Arrestin-like N-terminal domain-containing protein n=1 Tax=Agrocybe pediades TaxID=84607 RepID=A0A8H4QTF8_9AGAR|nr:hypothetical protein D9613_005967 [Agrocybe pediades]KAF9562594.1 hypothetical protein CPC08DRAFT_373752 [Agrocybe pediades]